LTVPEAANKRFLVGGKKYYSQLAADALKTVPELKGRLPKDSVEVPREVVFGDVEEWNEKLGLKLRSAEETFVLEWAQIWLLRNDMMPSIPSGSLIQCPPSSYSFQVTSIPRQSKA